MFEIKLDKQPVKFLKNCDRYMRNNNIRSLTRYYHNGEKEICAFCGNMLDLEFHHYSMNVDDFIVLCKKCHKNSHKNLED